MLILDSSSPPPDLSSRSSPISGAILTVNIEEAPYNTPQSKLILSSYSTLVWVQVSSRNMEKVLRLLDSTIEQSSTRISPGVWNKMVNMVDM